MDRRTLLRAAAVAGSLLVAGCVGDDGTPAGTPTPTDSPTESPTATAGRTPTVTDAPTPTAPTTGSPTGTRTPPTDAPTGTATSPADVSVTVAPGGSLRFDPASFTVAVGDTVRWTWDGSGHNVKPAEDGTPEGAEWTGTPGDRTETYGAGYRYGHTFTVAGRYEYYCVPHRSSGMTGALTVE